MSLIFHLHVKYRFEGSNKANNLPLNFSQIVLNIKKTLVLLRNLVLMHRSIVIALVFQNSRSWPTIVTIDYDNSKVTQFHGQPWTIL